MIWATVLTTPLACKAKLSPFAQGSFVDLSHSFDAQTIYWPTAASFKLEKEFNGYTERGYFYSANKFQMSEHGGTHIDAPYHFNAKGRTLDQIPLAQLQGLGVVIDVRAATRYNPDYQISTEDILNWEKKNGRLPDHAIVLFQTGYGKFWPDRKKYLGTEQRGPEAIAQLHFPGLAPAAAGFLANDRQINMVGIDTASIDHGQSKRYDSHQILFEHNIPAMENLANLDLLPRQDFTIVALPMKIAGGSGGPLRVVAWIKNP